MWSFRRLSLSLAVSVAALLAGCGFQLRSPPAIPAEMARTYIATADPYSLFYRKFRDRLIDAGVDVVESPQEATAEFSILTDDTGQRVLSVSARNIPREYEVYYTINYGLSDGDKVLMEPQLRTLTRDYTYDERRVLGKEKEEELLREAIADDLVRVVLMQLSSLE
jgi:LPS-assembly lipoprotein